MYTLKIFPIKDKTIGYQYTKLLIIHIFQQQNYFQHNFLDQCRNNPNNLQNIPSEIKADLKNGYVTGVVFKSGYDPPEGVR